MRPFACLVLLASCLVLLASTAALAAPPGSILGDWKTPAGSVVRVGPCGANVCLTLVALSPSAPETTDQNNPDAGLRHRSLCGLTIGKEFHQADALRLTGGQLYDPKNGHTYSGTITEESTAGGEVLHLHGYIGISLFGRTETWHRAGEVTACR